MSSLAAVVERVWIASLSTPPSRSCLKQQGVLTHTASNFLHDLPKGDTCLDICLEINDLPYFFYKSVVHTGRVGS